MSYAAAMTTDNVSTPEGTRLAALDRALAFTSSKPERYGSQDVVIIAEMFARFINVGAPQGHV